MFFGEAQGQSISPKETMLVYLVLEYENSWVYDYAYIRDSRLNDSIGVEALFNQIYLITLDVQRVLQVHL